MNISHPQIAAALAATMSCPSMEWPPDNIHPLQCGFAPLDSDTDGNAQERRDRAHMSDVGHRGGNPTNRFCGFIRNTPSTVIARMR